MCPDVPLINSKSCNQLFCQANVFDVAGISKVLVTHTFLLVAFIFDVLFGCIFWYVTKPFVVPSGAKHFQCTCLYCAAEVQQRLWLRLPFLVLSASAHAGEYEANMRWKWESTWDSFYFLFFSRALRLSHIQVRHGWLTNGVARTINCKTASAVCLLLVNASRSRACLANFYSVLKSSCPTTAHTAAPAVMPILTCRSHLEWEVEEQPTTTWFNTLYQELDAWIEEMCGRSVSGSCSLLVMIISPISTKCSTQIFPKCHFLGIKIAPRHQSWPLCHHILEAEPCHQLLDWLDANFR